MARQRKPQEYNHSFRMIGDYSGEAIIVKGGKKYTYLWVGDSGKAIYCFTGTKTLRAFAKAILKEIGDD